MRGTCSWAGRARRRESRDGLPGQHCLHHQGDQCFHRPRARASGSITAHSTPTTRSTISPSSTGANSCSTVPTSASGRTSTSATSAMITTGSTAGLDRVEAAYIREAMKRSFFRHVPGRPRYQSTSTSTPTLPWGAPNPNFGRPFIAANNTRNTNESDAHERAAHRLSRAGLRAQDRAVEIARPSQPHRYVNRYELDERASPAQTPPTSLTTATRAFVNPATGVTTSTPPNGIVRTAVYIGPSLADRPSPSRRQPAGIQSQLQPTTATGWYWDRNTNSS